MVERIQRQKLWLELIAAEVHLDCFEIQIFLQQRYPDPARIDR